MEKEVEVINAQKVMLIGWIMHIEKGYPGRTAAGCMAEP